MTNEKGETLLATLHRLQEVELKLASIRGKRQVRARRVSIRERKHRDADNKLREIVREIRERQVRLDALTLDVSAREDAVQKHREALNKAKTNKEYAGILAAMNTEKADTAKIETGVFALMEEVQTRKNVATSLEAENQKLLEELHSAEKMLGEFDAEQQQKKADLEGSREQFSESLPPGTFSTFTRIAGRQDGEAMAPVTKLHPKRDEYCCSGCNMTVSLEIINVLRCRDEITQCGSCGRILFVDPHAEY